MSKKDLLQNAAKDELSSKKKNISKKESSKNLNDNKSNHKSNNNKEDKNKKGIISEILGENAEKDTLSKKSQKKDLSKKGLFVRIANMFNKKNKLEKYDPQYLDQIEFDNKEKKPVKVKLFLFVIILAIIAGGAYYFNKNYMLPKSYIVLSSSHIIEYNLPNTHQEFILPANKPVYYSYFSASQIGEEEIIVKIYEISDVDGSYQEKLVGEGTRTVKPQWKRISSMFQKEFFMHGGRFKIQLLKTNQEILAEQYFQVK